MRIAVVGSYGVGMTMYMERVPDAGETLEAGAFAQGPGGKGSNQAIGARRLGGEVALCSIVGPDELGRAGHALWNAEGIATDGVVTGEGATMVGFILVEAGGENRIAIAPGCLQELTAEHVRAQARSLRTADVVLTNLEIPLAAAHEAMRIGRSAGRLTILNPAPARSIPLDVLREATYLTPNLPEALALTGLPHDADPNAVLDALRRLAPDPGIIITLGEAGAIVDADGRRVHVDAVRAPSVVDTAGAGDAFNAAFAVALAGGADALAGARYGTVAGAFAVSRREVVPGLGTASDLRELATAAGVEDRLWSRDSPRAVAGS